MGVRRSSFMNSLAGHFSSLGLEESFAYHHFKNYRDEANVAIPHEGYEIWPDPSFRNHQSILTKVIDHLTKRVAGLFKQEGRRKGGKTNTGCQWTIGSIGKDDGTKKFVVGS